jgi:hypothetical protein
MSSPLEGDPCRSRACGLPQIVIISVDLPAPLAPISADDLALPDLDVDALQRGSCRNRS